MSVAASGQGGLMVPVDPEDTDALLAKPHARPFEMRGREMQGWLRVDPEGLRTKRQLAPGSRAASRMRARVPPSRRTSACDLPRPPQSGLAGCRPGG
jgi:hypothetical protein